MPLKFAKLCRAKARTKNYQQCSQPAMPNGLCRMHFGKGTGPKTEEGRRRQAKANLKHGLYTNEAIVERKMMRRMMNWRAELNEK